MTKFLFLFLFFCVGVHEVLLEQSSIYLYIFLFCTGIMFLIGMLWYFLHYRPISNKLMRFSEDLEFIEAHYLTPELQNKKSSILFSRKLNNSRELFYFRVQGNLFGGLFSYGDNGGIYHRLKTQGRQFNITLGTRDIKYDKMFVVWDSADKDNSDFKKLKKFVDELKNIFNSDFSNDVSDGLKILHFHLKIYIARLLRKEEQKCFEGLFNDLYVIIREIQLAADETECKVKDDIDWFNFRLKILGSVNKYPQDSFHNYWGDSRPRKIAGDIIEQFKKLPDGSDILLVKYPSGWRELTETVNQYLYKRVKAGKIRLYTADAKMEIHTASINYDENNNLSVYENVPELPQNRIFDFIFCFNLMQHCRKSQSKAYFRKFSGMISDNGFFVIVAAVSRDPKIDTFVSERITDRVLMYWDKNQFPKQDMFCMNTQDGKVLLQLQDLDCNDGKYSFLAKNIYSTVKDNFCPNLFCGSLLKIASRGKMIAASLIREKFISHSSMSVECVFSVVSEVIPGFEIKEIYLKYLPEESESVAYLSFSFDSRTQLKMHELKIPENESNKGDLKSHLATAAEKLAYQYPPLLFRENPQPYIEYIFRSANEKSEFSNLFSQTKFSAKNAEGKEVELAIFLHKEQASDMDGYILAMIDNHVFATYFPGKKLLSEEDFYQYSNDNEEKISTTHQISWKTLNHRLEQIDCKAETVKFYSIGPQAIYSTFGEQCIKENYSSEDNVYETIANHFDQLKLSKQLLLLDQLDVHDMLIVSRKRRNKKYYQKITFWDLL